MCQGDDHMKLRNAKQDNLMNKETGWFPQIAIGFALVFTFFITIPIELFVPNQSDFFWFDIWFMIKHMLLAGGIAFLLFELICTVCRLLPGKGYLISLSFFLGVAIALYVQGYYLCMNNEVLIGGEPDWSMHTGSMILNLAIWLAIIAVCIATGLAKPKYLKKACIFAPLLIVVMPWRTEFHVRLPKWTMKQWMSSLRRFPFLLPQNRERAVDRPDSGKSTAGRNLISIQQTAVL